MALNNYVIIFKKLYNFLISVILMDIERYECFYPLLCIKNIFCKLNIQRNLDVNLKLIYFIFRKILKNIKML